MHEGPIQACIHLVQFVDQVGFIQKIEDNNMQLVVHYTNEGFVTNRHVVTKVSTTSAHYALYFEPFSGQRSNL